MAATVDDAAQFLEKLLRYDLAALIAVSKVEARMGTVHRAFFEEAVEIAAVEAPSPVDEALQRLPPHDRKRIAQAIAATNPFASGADDITVTPLGTTVEGAVALLAELIIHREMMIDVATGGTQIQEVNDYYIARQVRLRRDLPAEASYANEHTDLWAWYHHWKANLGTYADRRQYVRALFAPSIEAMANRPTSHGVKRQPTGWERVDRALEKARAQYELAAVEEDFQTIGLLCREIIISLGQAVFDPQTHQTLDGVTASKTDANRMLESYVAHVFPGDSYKEVRAHHRASLALALNLQHRRTATKKLAALCLEATASTVAVISIIARDRF